MSVDILDEMAKFVFATKYARFDEKKQRREVWNETVDRVEDMHLRKFEHLDQIYKDEIRWAFDKVREKKVLPSMRSMQFGGKAIETNNLKTYNCAVRHVDSIRAFAEITFSLLCGNGIGIGLSKKFLGRLPDLVNADDKNGTVVTYVVQDDIQGWADSVEALLMCYFRNTAYSGRKIVFDYSKIRRKGSKLKTSGGKAPGYAPLKNAHTKIKALLDHIIENLGVSRLGSIHAYDLLMHVADCVVSGGSRRSATAVIFEASDADMLEAKTFFTVEKFKGFEKDAETGLYEGKVLVNKKWYSVDNVYEFDYNQIVNDSKISWFYVEPQRARSNNSILLARGSFDLPEFHKIVDNTRQFGEPGFVFAEKKAVQMGALFNPCFEVNFIPVTEDGICGLQVCNLTSINGEKIETEEDFANAVKAATIIGTLQATYTEFPYLSPAAKKLTEEEALLGVSITAMMSNPNLLLNPEIQQKNAELAVNTNKEWAKILGINQAARVTLVKPEGTGTLALGSVSPGIHPAHSHKFFRRIQMNTQDNVYQWFKGYNENHCEKSIWNSNGTDDVATFPIEISKDHLIKSQLTAVQHLEYVKSTQINWVNPGTTKANKKPITHNVSCTIIVKDSEWEEVIQYLFDNQAHFSAVSLISDSGDKNYKQAPYEAVTTKEDKELFDKLTKTFRKVDYEKMYEGDDTTELQKEMSCFGGACAI